MEWGYDNYELPSTDSDLAALHSHAGFAKALLLIPVWTAAQAGPAGNNNNGGSSVNSNGNGSSSGASYSISSPNRTAAAVAAATAASAKSQASEATATATAAAVGSASTTPHLPHCPSPPFGLRGPLQPAL